LLSESIVWRRMEVWNRAWEKGVLWSRKWDMIRGGEGW
jgi:hypothetical protein